jgi:hypothetical protein
MFATTLSSTPAEEALHQGAEGLFLALTLVFFSVPKILVMTVALTYSRMALGYTFIALLAGTVAIQFLVRLPIAHLLRYDHTFLADLAVAFVDVIYIKILSHLEVCQSFEFERVKWRYAILAAFLGNRVSFFIFRRL